MTDNHDKAIKLDDLMRRRCKACEGDVPPLSDEDADAYLAEVEGWTREGTEIVRQYSFKNYYQTVSFVNAAAWIAHREDHHPDMTFGYKTCTVRYSTHAVGGLTENDFICAAKINALLDE